MSSTSCLRCDVKLRGLSFYEFATEDQDVYCENCSKVFERDSLRGWAGQWAAALIDGDQDEAFFTVLAAAWKEGFTKARTFDDATPVFKAIDNPFTDESELMDPLLTAEGRSRLEAKLAAEAEAERAKHEVHAVEMLDEIPEFEMPVDTNTISVNLDRLPPPTLQG